MTRYSAYIRNNGKNRKKTGIFLWHFSSMVAGLIVVAGCAVSSEYQRLSDLVPESYRAPADRAG